MSIRQILAETKLLVHILVCMFGISSWIGITALMLELPILVTYLPEEWTLPSFIIIITQVANIGPLIFAILNFLCKNVKLEQPTSTIIICVSMCASLLVAFFWRCTTYVFGDLHASALLVLTLILSMVYCTSPMAFLAFMSRLKLHYLPSFFLGEGIGSIVPSLLSLAQGAGSVTCRNGSSGNVTVNNLEMYPEHHTPMFSVQTFFLLISALIASSFISFILLSCHPYCQQEYVKRVSRRFCYDKVDNDNTSNTKLVFQESHRKTYDSVEEVEISCRKERLSRPMFLFLMVNTAFVTMQINTFLMSVQSYTSLPYGLQTYHLAAIVTNIAKTIGSFTNFLLPQTSTPSIVLLTFIGTGFSIYLIILAAMSPTPPLVGTRAGGPLSIVCWAFAGFFLLYAKIAIGGRLRQQGGRRPMLWYGAFTQIGSFVGGVTAFVIINVYSILEAAPFC